VHTPHSFTSTWAGKTTDVVDISKDQPVYDPRGLEHGGIQYHKFPTVSKVPPQADEIDAFIKLIDSIRARRTEEGATGLIGVHCHYGFNRTGYFIVCYLVERCGMTVKEGIETFAMARPNGIRHSHFLDRLYVRYNVDGAGTGQ
jgi:protein-tyrosine phosphatase